MATEAPDPQHLHTVLQTAVLKCSERCLYQAAKWSIHPLHPRSRSVLTFSPGPQKHSPQCPLFPRLPPRSHNPTCTQPQPRTPKPSSKLPSSQSSSLQNPTSTCENSTGLPRCCQSVGLQSHGFYTCTLATSRVRSGGMKRAR